MPEESVELVRGVYDAFNRGDWDAVFSNAHPDIEVTFQRGLIAGTYRGRDRLQEILTDQREAFDSWVMEVTDVFGSGEQVVAIVLSRVRPHGTEAEMELRNGFVWTVRDGTLVSMVGYPDPDDALREAGIGA